MRLIKFIAVFLLVGIISLSTPLMLVADELPTWNDLWRDNNRLRDEIRRLDDELAGLRRQIELLQMFNQTVPTPAPEPTPVPTPTPVFAPHLRLLNPQNITVARGEVVYVPITVRNIGTHTAFNVLTQVRASAGSPFYVEFVDSTNHVAQITENAQRNMMLRITVDENAEPGNDFAINLEHFFRNHARVNLPPTTDTIRVRVVGVAQEPTIRVGGFRSHNVAPIQPGQRFSASININNMGEADARDVVVSLPNMSADAIFFVGDPNDLVIPSLEAGGEVTKNFMFQASERLSGGTLPIDFTVSFRDSGGSLHEETITFFVNIAVGAIPNLEIINLVTPVGRVMVGETGTFTFTLQNVSTTEARNIRVEAIPEDDSIVPMGTPGIQNITSLAPGAEVSLTFSFSPRERAVTRSYTINFSVSFLDVPSGERITIPQFVAFNVYNPEERDEPDDDRRVQIPRVIVSNYSVYPLIPRAGREFDMSITFRNTNMTRSVNNIRITLESLEGTPGQGAVFTPVGGSNTLFVDFLGPGEEITKNLTFFTVNDALPRSYNMRVEFEYQCQDFAEFRASENLSITVAQVVRLETDGISIPSMGTVGGNIWLRFSVLNSGRVPLYGMRIRVDGPFDGSEFNRFIGNLAAQRQISYDGQFRPLEEGTHEGAIVIYGEDATGAIIEYRHDFTILVDEGFAMGGWDFGGDFVDRDWMWGDDMFWGEEEEGFDFFEFIQRPVVWIPAAGVLGAIVVAIIVVVVVKKRKSSKLDFDDEV